MEVEAVLLCLEMFWVLNKETQETFNFQTFHSTTLHLFSTQKMVKERLLTLMSNNFLYFNSLSYEMVQHKLNQELTYINITLKNIYNIGIERT